MNLFSKGAKIVLIIFLVLLNVGLFNRTAAAGDRQILPFDTAWRFLKADAQSAEKPEFDDSSWRKLDVPHDWSIEGPFDANNPTLGSGGFLPSGVAWYRKHFTVPACQIVRNLKCSDLLKDKHLFIEFDGVMSNSEVWINGHYLGKRPNGYITFGYELTGHLNLDGKDNVIAVKVDTSQQPASRWYTGAGIYRHVRIVMKGSIYIPRSGTFVTTPKVSERGATVTISTEVVNTSDTPSNVDLYTTLYAPNGKVAKSIISGPQTVAPNQTIIFKQDIVVKYPDRWSLDHGALYKAVVSIKPRVTFGSGLITAKTLDTEIVPFGIRTAEFVPATGFWLNGKNIKVKGACLHHDGSAFGSAVPFAVWERRLTELRKLGINAIRTAHNPPAPEFLDLADRMGFLVMDELFDQWTLGKNAKDYHLYFDEWSKADVRDTVRRDRNHPSVIIYSAGNEIRDNHADQEKAKSTLRGLVDTFHENDPTRPVTQALFRPNIEGANDYNNGLAEILDVVGQNYREKEILAAYRQKPTRKIIGTENTHDLAQWLAFRDHPEYAGQFIWVGVDYLGESAAWPDYAYGKGLLTRTAEPRPVAFQRQSWWSEKPMVYIARRVAPPVASPTDPGYLVIEQRRTQTLFGDWTPKNLSAHDENVEIYSNCDEVELFLNGRSLGSKAKPTDDSPRNWHVSFETGTIRAVGRNIGKEAAVFELKTAGKPARILLSASKPNITNDWDDVVFVTATVVDAYGVIVPGANDLIEFSVTDPGTIAAVDSSDNADHDPFRSNKRHAFQGTCMAMIKEKRAGRTIKVTANATGIAAGSVVLTSHTN